MLEVKIPDTVRSWDRYEAFHAGCAHSANTFTPTKGGNYPVLVLFDTGELICTMAEPTPDFRGDYASVGVSITTSNDADTRLYLPDGTPVVKAWLDNNGMQYLLSDWLTCTVVRLDGMRRYKDVNKPMPITFGIPERFQYNCYGYIAGPGHRPVSHSKIIVRRPLRSARFDAAELEHIHMIVATGQAAMKLTDHEAATGPRVGDKASADPDVLLKCRTWQDVPSTMLPALAQKGCTRRVQEFDYLLTEANHGA